MGVKTFIEQIKASINENNCRINLGKLVFFLGLIFIVAIVVSGAVSAKTWNIKPGTNTIKNGITHASPGDTLNLTKGNYNEHDLVVNKNLIITGPTTTGTPTVNINGQYQGRIFHIPLGVKVTLQNLLITKGATASGNSGAGIFNRGNLNIKHCNIYRNFASGPGGGIYNYGGKVTLSGCNINYNIGGNYGGPEPYGGGIYNDGGTIIMKGCNVNKNTADMGGGIYDYVGTLTMTGCNVYSNIASYGSGIYIDSNTCHITSSHINSNSAANEGGAIFNQDSNLILTNSYIINNIATLGGGIWNTGTCSIKGSHINYNKATFTGGGIDNSGTVKVTGSSINSNTADSGGGIFNSGNCSLTGSTSNSNSANEGGGIYCNSGNLNVKGSNFELNKANHGKTIYNYGGTPSSRILHFNRIYNLTPGFEIYSVSGNMDIKNNWWCSNTNPKVKIFGNVFYSPWLVLKSNANHTIIRYGGTSKIKANLWCDSSGKYHNPTNGHVPNGIRVSFTTTLGSVTGYVAMINGAATATLHSGTKSGIAYIKTKLDNQSVKKSVKIDATAPKVSSTVPTNLKKGFSRWANIIIRFSENIKISKYYNSIKIKNLATGKYVTISKYIRGNTLNIKTVMRSKYTLYRVIIPKAAIRDYMGNNLRATYTFIFKTGA